MPKKNFFDTSHLNGKLAQKTVQGGMAIGIVRVVNFMVSLGSTAVLARLLRPEDFGLVALVWSILGFVMVFREAGLSLATVQKKEVTHGQVSNLFWVNLAVGIAIALIVVVTSPLFGIIYNDPRLTPVAAALSIPAIFSGLTIQHQALARRHMKFWLVQSAQLGGTILGVATAIMMAFYGVEYWALVWQRIVTSVFTCMILWIAVPWLPGLPRRGTGVRNMLNFGGNIAGSRFLKIIPKQLDNILIGSFIGAASLGFYSKAKRLFMMPLQQVNYPANSVTFPALSRLQNDPENFRKYFYQGIKLLVSMSMPIIVCLAIVADDLVPFFLGKGWGEVVVLFRALAPACIVQSLDVTQGWATVPLGQAKKRFNCSLIDTIITIMSFVIGINWGAFGVALAFSVSSVLKFVPLNIYALNKSYVTVSGLFKYSLLQPILFTIIAASGTIILMSGSYFNNHFIALLCTTSVFGILYLTVPFIFSKGRKLFEPAQEAWRVTFRKKTVTTST